MSSRAKEVSASKPAEKEKRTLFDTGMILGAATATIYYVHYLYVYSFYQVFGISLIDLHYSMQEILIFNPWVGAIMLLFVLMVTYTIVTDKAEPSSKGRQMTREQARIGLMVVLILVLILIGGAIDWWGGHQATEMVRKRTNPVTFMFDGKKVSDYFYLTRTDDSYYFYKPVDNSPNLLIVRADEVKALSFGKILP